MEWLVAFAMVQLAVAMALVAWEAGRRDRERDK